MSAYHDCNIVFRCPTTLKERMKEFTASNQELLSSFIRSACLERLERPERCDANPAKHVAKHLEVRQ